MAEPKIPKKKKVQPELKVSTTTPEGATTETAEPIGEPIVYTEPACNVGISMGFTRNMGNYNSVKMQVSLFVPCYPHEVDDTFDAIKEIVEAKVNILSDEVNAMIGGA